MPFGSADNPIQTYFRKVVLDIIPYMGGDFDMVPF